ncbi:MAG: GIY-YIG nuclease family protein [Candidatus Doudnabacteria bacterium]
MQYVYILKSKKDGQNYIGCTNDLKRRFNEHNSQKILSIRSRVPFEIIYYEAYKLAKDAWTREHNLKLRKRSYVQLKKRQSNSLVGG